MPQHSEKSWGKFLKEEERRWDNHVRRREEKRRAKRKPKNPATQQALIRAVIVRPTRCEIKACPFPAVWDYTDINNSVVAVCTQHRDFYEVERGNLDIPILETFVALTGQSHANAATNFVPLTDEGKWDGFHLAIGRPDYARAWKTNVLGETTKRSIRASVDRGHKARQREFRDDAARLLKEMRRKERETARAERIAAAELATEMRRKERETARLIRRKLRAGVAKCLSARERDVRRKRAVAKANRTIFAQACRKFSIGRKYRKMPLYKHGLFKHGWKKHRDEIRAIFNRKLFKLENERRKAISEKHKKIYWKRVSLAAATLAK